MWIVPPLSPFPYSQIAPPSCTTTGCAVRTHVDCALRNTIYYIYICATWAWTLTHPNLKDTVTFMVSILVAFEVVCIVFGEPPFILYVRENSNSEVEPERA